MNPDVGELPGYLALLVQREGDARCLFPVPEGRVENSDRLMCVSRGEEDNTPQPSFPGTWLTTRVSFLLKGGTGTAPSAGERYV